MLNMVHKNKGGSTLFATFKSDGNSGHEIYLSSYGTHVSELLEKYLKEQRLDNEELFTELDKHIEEASLSVGYSATLAIEDGHAYITTFQNGIGVTPEEEAGIKRYTSRGRREKTKISIISPDLAEGIDMTDEIEDDVDLSDELIDETDLDEDQ